MRWTVVGADKNTGQERSITVEASTEADAEKLANRAGLIVSDVSPVDALVELAQANQAKPPPRTPTPIVADYRTPEPEPPRSVPSYIGLKIGSIILGVFAAIYYAIGALIWITTFAEMSNNPTPNRAPPPGAMYGVAGTLVVGLIFGMVGGLLHAFSAGCVALRDIARNSFK